MHLASAGWALGGAVVASIATRSVWVAAPAAGVAAVYPRWRARREQTRRLGVVQQSWPDGLRHLVGSLRSGASLNGALDQLVRSGPDPLRAAFRLYPELAKALGVPAALEAVRSQLADTTTDRVVEVLLIANEYGGPLVTEILDDLAEATTEDLRTLEEIHTNSLEQRINARIVFAVPWLVLVLLTARQGPYRDFYRAVPGLVVVVVAGVLSIAGVVFVSHLGREPIEERVFGGGERPP